MGDRRGYVIDMIESSILTMIDELGKPDGKLRICLEPRIAGRDYELNAETGVIEFTPTERCRVISFPGKTPEEAWRFSTAFFQMLHSSALIHHQPSLSAS